MLFNDIQTQMNAFKYKLRTKNNLIVLLFICFNAFFDIPFALYRYLAKNNIKMQEPKKILVIRADRIGDMILTTPVFICIKRLYPNSTVVCLASTLSSQLVRGSSFIDKIIIYDPPWFDKKKDQRVLHDYLKVWKSIRAEKFDMAIDMRGNYNNFIFLMCLTMIPRRVSYIVSLGSFLLTDKVSFEPGKHETEYFMDIIRYLGGDTIEGLCPDLELSDAEHAYAEHFSRLHHITSNDLVIAIHPGAGAKRTYKRWPEDHFIELGKMLVENYNAKLIIAGSKTEVDLAKRIEDGIGRDTINTVGKINRLKDLAAILQYCTVCIATSTGIMHLAAAVGTPVIVLCGPEDYVRWRPLGDRHSLIVKDVPCRPCREESCPYEGECLRSILPSEVIHSVEAYIH